MTVRLHITTSLDGLVAGTDDRFGKGLGNGGEALHYWVFGRVWTYDDQPDGDDAGPGGIDRAIVDENLVNAGALVIGRKMFDAADGWGGGALFGLRSFVVTHTPPSDLSRYPGFEFVTGGIEDALQQAREAAGDKHVTLMGGANLAQQYLNAGLVDEIDLTISPVILGAGRPLFANLERPTNLERVRVLESPWATHVRYRVVHPA